jgi:hypothetical protein
MACSGTALPLPYISIINRRSKHTQYLFVLFSGPPSKLEQMYFIYTHHVPDWSLVLWLSTLLLSWTTFFVNCNQIPWSSLGVEGVRRTRCEHKYGPVCFNWLWISCVTYSQRLDKFCTFVVREVHGRSQGDVTNWEQWASCHREQQISLKVRPELLRYDAQTYFSGIC